ncbi:hypothetical protein GCM10008107_05920 [Psychrosphaera saromensis]|uniref:HTH merR-type domain-containing protein n=1 Tax=Psychrosphaera saromensis TaxID=716813 RepID=A0A2S7UXQ9_9GAMM|nr:MerR family transcriptional regulator [Psychrosphaera saromensis]PQJ54485.1 hypothetical protein BTO11_13055 [Psychrosphaera saromensis]GHB59572.1 hypothetical protein GCM10008107_05920 [Psychrosphaera saromensis]GLQ14313.1 hypothetical protein GCM10007917_17680 [Psychrosphaera saromensis]
MKVSNLAKALNTTADTVRYYTKIGLLHPQKSQLNGYMFYNAQQQQRLSFILTARHLGFSVKDITNIFHETDNNHTGCKLVRDIIKQRLVEVEQQFLDAQALMNLMKQAIGEWDHLPDKTPTSQSICHLMDTFSAMQSQIPPTKSLTETLSSTKANLAETEHNGEMHENK